MPKRGRSCRVAWSGELNCEEFASGRGDSLLNLQIKKGSKLEEWKENKERNSPVLKLFGTSPGQEGGEGNIGGKVKLSLLGI